MFVISAHADTGFRSHSLDRLPGDVLRGPLDNFVGVYAVMKAFFSGKLTYDHVRIELTYGEEAGLLGAKKVLKTLHKNDLVAVVDVTGTETVKDFVIEKCRNSKLKSFLETALSGLSYDIYEDCPDPVSCFDETDIYVTKCPYTFFLGIPCTGGDYNLGPTSCREHSIDAVAQAVIQIAAAYPRFDTISKWASSG